VFGLPLFGGAIVDVAEVGDQDLEHVSAPTRGQIAGRFTDRYEQQMLAANACQREPKICLSAGHG
jgi:hypothetical protein